MRSATMTKSLLMGLEEGAYLTANVVDERGCTLFEGPVAPMAYRFWQWKALVSAKVNGRTVRIFETKGASELWRDSVKGLLRVV